MSKAVRADLLLVLMTIIWGGTFPLLRNAVVHIDPEAFVFFRFLLAAFVLLPIVLWQFKQTTAKVILAGVFLSFINYGTYVFQGIGLETISSARSSFITGTSAVMVPFIAPLFGLGLPRRKDILSVLICLLGLYLLTGANVAKISVGDLWTFACALSVATNIVFIQWLTRTVNNALLLTFFQVILTLPLTFLLSAQLNLHVLTVPDVYMAVIYCGLLATVVTLFIQARFQRDTTAVRAGIIFTLEPVFACLFAWAFNHEGLPLSVVVGGTLILLSLLVNTCDWHLGVARQV